MNHIFQWEFKLQSQSPLHIGDDDNSLLLDDQGRPFLPGTSWAGACRAYLRNLGWTEEETKLFGEQGKQGKRRPSRLIFSDGVCITLQPFDVRPRVALDGASKTVRRNKFEQVTVSAGTEFRVKLILRTDEERDRDTVEHILGALDSGYIRLGKYKSIGGGKFKIVDGRFVHYDCRKTDDLEAYVHQTKPMELWQPSGRLHPDWLSIHVTGRNCSPLLIAGDYPNDSQKPDRSAIQAWYFGEAFYIMPGSSMKGVLRHRVQRIANLLGIDASVVEHMFNGKLLVEDTKIQNPKTKVYSRIAIHPLTGGVKDGALVEEETVSGEWEMNWLYAYDPESVASKATLALLLFALRDLGWRRVSMGSGSAIGRGDLQIDRAVMRYKDQEVVLDFERQSVEDGCGWMNVLQEALETVKKGVKAG